ncbi:MAG: ATP-binding protein [Candidatus Pacebacteria bacterium]|nr:ATP-binding protein [Candidatus Paceibacterota bacterium]
MVVVYGYFFNSSTEKIIKSHFLERKAKNELKELSEKLEEKVEGQTRDMREQNLHLEELLNMKGDFLRTVNHQLNTPLTIMKNAFAMMKDKSLSSEQGMKIAAHGLERMSSTIEDFWNAFELDEQKEPVDLAETDIETIVKDMMKEKKKMELAIARKLSIRLIKPDWAVPKVLCDHRTIGQAISNLLDNAVFYTQKGSIKVWFEKIRICGKDFLKIFISDTGEGISLEDREDIFEKFFRGSATASINPNGSGLGLYIARNIVESSGGEIKLEQTDVGRGTTFSFTLRIAKSENKAKKLASKRAVADCGKSAQRQPDGGKVGSGNFGHLERNGAVIKKRSDVQEIAESNGVFAHFT